MSKISTHVLDLVTGRPAQGIPAELEEKTADGQWQSTGSGTTNADGRIATLLSGREPADGLYRLTFRLTDYCNTLQRPCFYPEVSITFAISDRRPHHIPLLLSAFGYSTYRGS